MTAWLADQTSVKDMTSVGINKNESGKTATYWYSHARPNPSHRYLWPVLDRVIAENRFNPKWAIDVGCGNGSTSQFLKERGFATIGVDPSTMGIDIAKKAYPDVEFHVGNAYDDLAARHGKFPLVISLEVIEHLYDPRSFVKTLNALLTEDGIAVISTPYNGYWKSLGLAIAGKWPLHHKPLRLGGHIKFFSVHDLSQVLTEEGFVIERIERVGRAIPAFAMSMVAVVRKRPSSGAAR